MTISQLNQHAINELSKYDSFVDTSSFDKTGKIMKVWNDAHAELVVKFFLPEFVLSHFGFCQGDATDEEILEIEKRLKTDSIYFPPYRISEVSSLFLLWGQHAFWNPCQ